MQGFKKPSGNDSFNSGLGIIERSFPNQTFPLGAIHEFTSQSVHHVAATNSFMAGIISHLMLNGGSCIWVSTKRTVFAPTFKFFGIDPARIIFIDSYQPKQALWSIEEALKCPSIAAVVGELGELTFTQSRRLQFSRRT